MPAAIPFMVKIKVSSRPGAYSLAGLSLTNSAGLVEAGSESADPWDKTDFFLIADWVAILWNLGSRILFSV
ncbi:hypothetical protein LUZ61_015488 [Rhynchospora tenuis]|uniref:Uncharacterized protein n=1 Tax=Rhynchospora tenuis TaxID=198213 RepID=A0AAD5Z3Q4_9POAL|nr:hypothetical protein LUZ61_015488 [Rhynchospora tenuis]